MNNDGVARMNGQAPLEIAADILLGVPRGSRRLIVQDALTFLPSSTLNQSMDVGLLRASLAAFWEELTRESIPIRNLRDYLHNRLDERTSLLLNSLCAVNTAQELIGLIAGLVGHLDKVMWNYGWLPTNDLHSASMQFDLNRSEFVSDLRGLVTAGRKFGTIYADPPWAYRNNASRAAAINHYPTMSLDAICQEPVADLAAKNAHLHLWTPNAFLRDAFQVIDAWGFHFKSCFVWVKDKMGMGNYWRVSHEFLLLGVRGHMGFRDRTEPSWKCCSRTVHSRKPEAVRLLVEKVSPGPYLEMYGRAEVHHSQWTVYGNQVERRLF